jgi:hypothetical protein
MPRSETISWVVRSRRQLAALVTGIRWTTNAAASPDQPL